MREITKFFESLTRSLSAAVRSLWSGGPVRALQQLVRFSTFLFWSVVGYCAGLNYRLLLQGLPALAAGVATLMVLAFSVFTPAQEIQGRYTEQAQNMVRTKEYSEALVCYERLAILQDDRPETLYDMARAAMAAGKQGRCDQIMNQLAPLDDPDRVGLAKAHLWMAARLLQSGPNPLRLQLAEAHLQLAIAGGIEDKGTANGMLGDIYLAKGKLDEAEPLLITAVKNKRPQARLSLAVLYARKGNLDASRDEARAAVGHFSSIAKANVFARTSA